jgi:hypothetical protein
VRDLEPDAPGHTGIVHITYSAPWPRTPCPLIPHPIDWPAHLLSLGTCFVHARNRSSAVNSRDVCAVMSSREYEDGTVIVIARSVADDNVPETSGTLLLSLLLCAHACWGLYVLSAIPTKRAGTVRAELLSSGYVITPRSEGGIHVAYILQIDFKGTPAVADDEAPAVGHGSVRGVSHPVACAQAEYRRGSPTS